MREDSKLRTEMGDWLGKCAYRCGGKVKRCATDERELG
jgi:hypothetical protein